MIFPDVGKAFIVSIMNFGPPKIPPMVEVVLSKWLDSLNQILVG